MIKNIVKVTDDGVYRREVPTYIPSAKEYDSATREEQRNNLSVVTAKGTWEADEVSQARMVNAISQLSRKPQGTIKKWKMKDGAKVDVVQADIEEALDLAVVALEDIIIGV